MNEQEYRETVIKMRMHQEGWFRRHSQSDLIEAKRLEKIIDAENRRWLDLPREVRALRGDHSHSAVGRCAHKKAPSGIVQAQITRS